MNLISCHGTIYQNRPDKFYRGNTLINYHPRKHFDHPEIEISVADVLLWRNRKVPAAVLIGVSAIWFLFEVAEYNFVTLLCHISITTMLVIFIWCMSAEYIGW